jgi:transcriptional regulator with XRE-family HTH domain
MNNSNFNRIKELLAKKGKTSIELANYLGVNTRTVSTWCTNAHQPEVATLYKISDFLEVEAGELLTPKNELKVAAPGKVKKKKNS